MQFKRDKIFLKSKKDTENKDREKQGKKRKGGEGKERYPVYV